MNGPSRRPPKSYSPSVRRSRVELGRKRSFQHAEIAASVADGRSVGGVLHHAALLHHVVVGEGEVRHAAVAGAPAGALGEQPLRLDPAVPVAGRPVLDVDGVQHAVTVERVIRAHRGELLVRPRAHEHPVERCGDLPDDLQRGVVTLLGHRSEHPLQVGRVPGVGFGDGHAPPATDESIQLPWNPNGIRGSSIDATGVWSIVDASSTMKLLESVSAS